MSGDDIDETTQKVVMGVSVGFGCLLLAMVFVLTYFLCRSKKQEKEATKLEESVIITPDGKPIGESGTDNEPVPGQVHTASQKQAKQKSSPSKSSKPKEDAAVQDKYYPNYKSPEPKPDYGAKQDPRTPVSAPLHDPFQRQLSYGPVDPHSGTQRSASGALAVVPFRKSQLPVSNVHYSVDGRLYTGQEDFKGRSDLGWQQLEQNYPYQTSLPPSQSPYEPYVERMVYERKHIADDGSAVRSHRARWSISSRNVPYRNPHLALSPVARSRYSSGRRSEQYKYSGYDQMKRKSVGKYEANWKVHSDRISPRESLARSSGRSDQNFAVYSTIPDQPVYAVVDKSRKQQGSGSKQYGRMDDFDIPLREFSGYRVPDNRY